VAGPGMAVEAVLHDGADEAADAADATRIRGIETIFRIRQPGPDPDPGAPEPVLVMVGAPGAPTRLVRSPFGELPRIGALSVAAIDYDDTGGVIISGLSSLPGRVRLYVSGAAIGETRVGPDGQWSYIASSVMPLGAYPVRAELLSEEGESPVVSVPFERLPPMPDTGTDDGALSVVFTPALWQIRRSLVGGGVQSTVIFAPERRTPG
ncbi:MAG: hypothetical protein WBA35_14625, partial [Litorimonas sp.]